MTTSVSLLKRSRSNNHEESSFRSSSQRSKGSSSDQSSDATELSSTSSHSTCSARAKSKTTATSEGHGRQMMEERLRSVISHPLCLPLLYLMYDQEELFPAANDAEAKRSIRQRNLEKLQDLPFSDWLTADADQPIDETAKQSYQQVLRLAIQHAELEALQKLAEDIEENRHYEEWEKQVEANGENPPMPQTMKKRKRGKETGPTLSEKSITNKIVQIFNEIQQKGGPNIHARAEKNEETNNDGFIDILFSDDPINMDSDKKCTPLMIMAFGGTSGNFWQKMHQCVMYMDWLGQAENNLCFDRPVLMSIVTVDYYSANAGTGDDAAAVRHGTGTSGVTTAVSNAADTGCNTTAVRHPDGTGGEAAAGGDTTTGIHGNVTIKMGLFFGLPPQKPKTENENVEESPKKSRIVLLWNAVSNDLQDASKKFGKILEVTAYFQKWVSDQQDYAAACGYQYFSSNCCKMGERVSVSTSGGCQFILSYGIHLISSLLVSFYSSIAIG
jgi:hypothetical protein